MAMIWAILSAVIFLHLLGKFLTKKKNNPSGPCGLPILGHLHLLGKNPHRALRDLARKHGPIMGMQFGSVPAVVVSSPAAAELVLKTHDHVFASRPCLDAFNLVSYGQKNLAFSPYGPYWREMRKLCTVELLSNLKINEFLPTREAELGLLVQSLKQAAERREPVDLSTKLIRLSRDMNFQMLFGRKFDGEDDIDEKGFKHVVVEASELCAQFNLADFFPFVGMLDLQGISRRIKILMKIFDDFLEKIIDDHVQNNALGKKQTEDFVDTMMGIMESGKADFKFDRSHIKAILLDLLIAGTDSSATVVDWALSELIRHPQVMKKLQEELESIVGMDQMVGQSHLDKLEYLNLVVKEALRLHTISPLLVPHESMEDCRINGFDIPKKTRIIVNVWAITRDPNVWPDPDKFLPERFIESNIDVVGQDFEFLPFGSGRRSCPGRQLGLTVVKHVLAQLVHCFDWKLSNGMKPSEMDMTEHFGIVIGRAQHLNVIPTYRLSK